MGKRFSWSKVDERVLRQLIAQADQVNEHSPASLRRLSHASLALTAAGTFGEPPHARWSDVLVEVALDAWLPLASGEDVEKLAELVRAGLAADQRNVSLTTKRQRIEFLRARRRTNNFKINVRQEFIRAHKIDVEGARGPSRSKIDLAPVELEGHGQPLLHELYAHQRAAHQELEALLAGSDGAPAGLLVLPTGSGKTETVVTWLLDRLQAEPTARVLWIAAQQELLEQAADRFKRWAACQPAGFARRARVIHGAAYPVSQLSSPDTDVALVTIQTLAGDLDKKRSHLESFLRRPTFVIVDEAHHAGAPTYAKLVERLEGSGVRALVGLTATPYPTSLAARMRFREHFPSDIHRVTTNDLVQQRILARPVLHTVSTRFAVELTEAQIAHAERADLPPEVLDQLDDAERNDLVVTTYLDHADQWGKTLLFATSIANADHLHALLIDQGVHSLVLHSRIDRHRASVLEEFRAASAQAVLVSVGMLTEGVDLPDARTAFLARPTTSRVLLQQMIGRVLRGPRAGGDPEANVVYFQDFWRNFADILEPPEVIDDWEPPAPRGHPGDDEPPNRVVIIEELADLGSGGQVELRRQFERSSGANIASTRLAGYYELPTRQIPVFEHQRAGLIELLDAAAASSLQGTPLVSFLDDAPPPHPTKRSLRELVDFVREFDASPPFVELIVEIGPDAAVARLLEAGPLSQDERVELLRDEYERSAVQLAYPTFEHFEEAVEQELRTRRQRRLMTERPPAHSTRPGRRALPRHDRDLAPAVELAIARCEQLLPAEMLDHLDPPDIRWSSTVTSSNLAFWTIKLHGRSRGLQSIRVNRLLRTTPKAVSDEALGYLVYHELLHHLLPGQGHDAEFRELEARWPDARELDAFFDSLSDRWDLRPDRYRDG